RRWTVLRGRPFRNVYVDVALVEQRRFDPEVDRARAHIGRRRRDRFFHYVAQVARDRHAPLAGHHRGLDREKFAPNLSPSTTCDDPDLILGLNFTVTVLGHTEEIGQVGISDADRLLL